MRRNHQTVSGNGAVVFLLAIITAIALERGLVSNSSWYWVLLFTLPLLFFFSVSGPGKVAARQAGHPSRAMTAGGARMLTLNKTYRKRKWPKNLSLLQGL